MSIEELIDRYGDDVLRLCTAYLGQRQLAEDAFQETFVKAWRNLPSFRGECQVKTWLSRIAVNTCRDMLRTGWLRMWRVSRPVEELENLAAPEMASPSPVRDAVLALPGKYREAVVLYYYQNMNIREIAQLLRLSPNSVSTRLRRARAQLQKQLKGEIEL